MLNKTDAYWNKKNLNIQFGFVGRLVKQKQIDKANLLLVT